MPSHCMRTVSRKGERSSGKVTLILWPVLTILPRGCVVWRGTLEAEPLFKECLEKRKAALGDSHPDTLTSKHSLAALCDAMGRDTDARPRPHSAVRDAFCFREVRAMYYACCKRNHNSFNTSFFWLSPPFFWSSAPRGNLFLKITRSFYRTHNFYYNTLTMLSYRKDKRRKSFKNHTSSSDN